MKCIYIVSIFFILFSFNSCVKQRVVSDSHIGEIEIRIRVLKEEDGSLKLRNGKVIGRISENLDIYDLKGNKIGFKVENFEENKNF